MMKRQAQVVMMLAVALLFGACDVDGTSIPEGIQNRVELQRFDTCEDLGQYIQDVAAERMLLYLEQQLEQAQRYGHYYGGHADAGAMSSSDSGSGSSTPTTPDEPKSHTETNNQVQGVDEPDFVKNDGTRILVLSNNTLYLSRSWPPTQLGLVGQLKIQGTARQMLLKGTKVMVFSSVSSGKYNYCPYCSYSQNGVTKVTKIDVSDMSNPQVEGELFLPGGYKAARRVGSSVRLVLSDNINWPSGLSWYPNYSSGSHYGDMAWIESEYHRLMEENDRLIRRQPLHEWLPTGHYKDAAGKKVEYNYNCSDFFHPNASVELGLVTVLSLDMDLPAAAPTRTSILGKTDLIYANQKSLYLANRHWWRHPTSAGTSRTHTYLHKLDISDIKKARYVASGGVEGTVLNQFALDEHKDFLRLATTLRRTASTSPVGSWGSSTEQVNRVTVLGEKDGALTEVGRTKDLAKTERIYSARFMGDRGYLVTFRQIDPLFTLDLKNPKNPRVVGELKVPGYSSYIHPVGDDHLLTIGMHIPAPGQGSWQDRALKLTIFDVSNFTAPKETLSMKIGTVNGRSEAASDHKAFNFYAERNLLAIPFSDWDYSKKGSSYWDSFVSEVRVFKVDVKGAKVTPVGALSQADMFKTKYSKSSYYYGYNWWVRRSVMATDQANNDYLYAISNAGIRVSSLKDAGKALGSAAF